MQRNWIGRSEGAEVTFAIEGRGEPVTVFTTRPDTLYGATFFVVAADSALAAELCAPEQRAELDAYLAEVRKLSDIERQSTDREKTGVFLGRARGQPGQRRADPGLRRRLRAGRLRHRRDHGRARARPARPGLRPRRSGCRSASWSTPACRTRRETGVATPGEGTLVNSGPLDGLSKAEAIADDHRRSWPTRAGQGRGQLPAARLAALPAAVLGRADPDRALRRRAARSRCPTTTCRSGCPTCAGRTWRPRASRRWPRPPTG